MEWVIKGIIKKPMGDFRDWDAIVTWTTTIADALKDAEHSHSKYS